MLSLRWKDYKTIFSELQLLNKLSLYYYFFWFYVFCMWWLITWIEAFTDVAVMRINIIATTVPAIIVTLRSVGHIITLPISNPLWMISKATLNKDKTYIDHNLISLVQFNCLRGEFYPLWVNWGSLNIYQFIVKR